MSRGGRGGWRGGGRGGGSSFANPAMRELMQNMSADEAKAMLITKEPTSLYPDFDNLPVPSKPTYDELACLKAIRSFRQEMKMSAFHLVPPPPPKDIERYSDKYHVVPEHMKQPLLNTVTTDLRFFPEELHSVVDATKKTAKKKNANHLDVDFDALESIETEEDGKEKTKEDGNDDDEENEEEIGEDDDFEEEGDYGDNYFDNGEADDDDGGGDDEAAF